MPKESGLQLTYIEYDTMNQLLETPSRTERSEGVVLVDERHARKANPMVQEPEL